MSVESWQSWLFSFYRLSFFSHSPHAYMLAFILEIWMLSKEPAFSCSKECWWWVVAGSLSSHLTLPIHTARRQLYLSLWPSEVSEWRWQRWLSTQCLLRKQGEKLFPLKTHKTFSKAKILFNKIKQKHPKCRKEFLEKWTHTAKWLCREILLKL